MLTLLPEPLPFLLSIDPGNDTGWSTWAMDTGALLQCGVIRPREHLSGRLPTHLVIELPRVYMRSKADPDNIISLARKVGRYEERYDGVPTTLVRPSDWKGNLDKDVMCRRIEAELTPMEKIVVDRDLEGMAEGKRHNAIDSIGLGKYLLRKWRLDAALKAGPPKAA